jgi:hypothetical protein
MTAEKSKSELIMEPVHKVLDYDLEALRQENEIKRASLWSQIESSQILFDRELSHTLTSEAKDLAKSQYELARLMLATAASINQTHTPIIKEFSQVELSLIHDFEKFNRFDNISPDQIADMLYHQPDLRWIVFSYFEKDQYGALDRLFTAKNIRQNLKSAFHQKYRNRINQVTQGAQAFILKYPDEKIQASPELKNLEKKQQTDRLNEQPNSTILTTTTDEDNSDITTKIKPPFWRLEGVRLVLSIVVLAVTLGGLLGWKFGPWESYYSLTTRVEPADAGWVQVNPLPESNGKYKKGTRVSLEARPTTGTQFLQWSGASEEHTPFVVVTMNGDKEYVAKFSQP